MNDLNESSFRISSEWFHHTLTLTKLTPLFDFFKDTLYVYAKEMTAMIKCIQESPSSFISNSKTSSTVLKSYFLETKFIRCQWTWVSLQEKLGRCIWMVFEFSEDLQHQKDDENIINESIKQFENKVACLLVSFKDTINEWGNFPLLVSRVPGDLLHIIITYLTTRFDAWASPFYLSQKTLTRLLQNYIESVEPTNEEAALPLELTFSTKGIRGLKKISVGIKGHNVQTWKERELDFFEGLKRHLKHQTAIDFNHLELCRVGCGGFVAASEGKLKMLKSIQQQVIADILEMEIGMRSEIPEITTKTI
ncbi:hypothetical protein PCANB_002786 [Pneumocystis canis]|nr:hypothetical protein PCK1_002895 [Pneumocystis canis]KAG5438298.1 hypothetical protein PCANB_002786 [Pneumocystis canis]